MPSFGGLNGDILSKTTIIASVCQLSIYLKVRVRYIHLNPLRAGIVSDLNTLKNLNIAATRY
jgi:hypothetical protein